MIATSHQIAEIISSEAGRLQKRLNRKAESRLVAHTIETPEFCLEDLRMDKDVNDLLEKIVTNMEEEIEKERVVSVESLTMSQIPRMGYSLFHFRADCLKLK